MTEYVIKEIGHRWIVYADRLRIAACEDENEALQLITEDSAAKAQTPNSADHKSGNVTKQNSLDEQIAGRPPVRWGSALERQAVI